MAAKHYDDGDIQILSGLDPVRKRPGMYIGSTDSRGLHYLIWELVDNAIDEALAGYGKEITVSLNQDGSVTVSDQGRGVPCGLNKETGLNSLEVIYSILHAGGKFGQDGGYKVSGGLHGVGGKVVNALSTYFDVQSMRDGQIHHIQFKDGGHKVIEAEVTGKTNKTGTIITFKPDPKIFSTVIFNYDTIKERLREGAFLIKGLKMNLIDKKNNKQESFLYEHGISEYVALLNEKKKPLFDVCYYDQVQGPIEVEVALQFVDTFDENIVSFANNVRTRDGGSHEVGFKTGLTRAVNDYARKFNLIKEKEANLDGTDIRSGMTAIVSVRVEEEVLEFEGQTKGKLGTPIAKTIVDNVTYDKFIYYLHEHNDVAKYIVEKALLNRKAREASRKARDQIRLDKKDKTELNLSGKLSPAQEKNHDINELFLVEGDSAGGSAKSGRDRRFQAILPLRGKVLNVEKASYERAIQNNEIQTMLSCIGTGFKARDENGSVIDTFNLEKARYHKIVIMTDADVDGDHICILLLTYFFRFMPGLIDAGYIYIAKPPLYKIQNGKRVEYAYSDEEKDEFLKEMGERSAIQRYKGLGEMDPSQLWETTMDPEKRTLTRVTMDDAEIAEKYFTMLMGDEVEPRKDFIRENAQYAEIDA